MSGERQPVTGEKFPFDQDYQRELLRLLCEDQHFARQVSRYLKAQHFESGVLVWAYDAALRYQETYGAMPSVSVLVNEARKLTEPQLQLLYCSVLEQVASCPLRDERWLRDSVLDFIRRNVFVAAFTRTRELYNGGRVDDAYQLMSSKLEEVFRIAWESPERSWLTNDFQSRLAVAQQADPYADLVPTQFPWLNEILGGGLHRGEMGVWIAYAKIGKSTMLLNHVVAASLSNRKALLVVLEGSLRQACARLDSSFGGVLYTKVKHGQIEGEALDRMVARYSGLRNSVVVRAFTDRWDVTIRDIEGELKELHDHNGWDPDLITVDYGDLLGSRGHSNSIYETQKASFRDLKSLANRGYALWTASQAQRPKEGAESKPHVIVSRMIADCYEKIRIADFLGSINCTTQEFQQKVARIYAELYRDNAADRLVTIRADHSRMLMWHEEGLTSDAMTGAGGGVPLMMTNQSRMPF